MGTPPGFAGAGQAPLTVWLRGIVPYAGARGQVMWAEKAGLHREARRGIRSAVVFVMAGGE